MFPCKEDLEKLRVIVVTLVTSGRYDLYYHPNVFIVIPTEISDSEISVAPLRVTLDVSCS